MDGRAFLWHLWRLVLGGVLLYMDERLFFFYAFTLLLNGLHQLNRLRAIVRVFQVKNDVRFAAIAEKLGASEDDFERINKDVESHLSAEQLNSLSKDWKLAIGS